MHIIAYTYEADVHCIDCTVKWARAESLRLGGTGSVRISANDLIEMSGTYFNGTVHDRAVAGSPVFDNDEWGEFGAPTNRTRYGVLIMNQALFCGDCHDVIAEYTVPVTGTDAWQGSLAIYRSNNQIN